jgi:DNA-binding MarR family transcriptional regulator
MKRARTVEPGPSKDEFRLEEFLPYQLSVTANRVSRLFAQQYSEGFGLTVPEWRVLAVVGRFEAISPSRVSEWTGMDKVKVSRAAATLVARNLLRQTQDPADGRARVLRMTRKGQRVFESVLPIARRLESELTDGLSRAEWTSFQRTLAKLHAHVERLTGVEDDAEPD